MMLFGRSSRSFFALILISASAVIMASASGRPTAEEVMALTKKVADWQIATFDEHAKYRARPAVPKKFHHENNYHDLDWHMAALYAGMNQFRKVADPSPKYTEWLKVIGGRNQWELFTERTPYHADDHAVGMTWLSLYEDFKDPAMLAPTQKRFDWILANPKAGSIEWTKDSDRFDRWGWCDALFMAPPVWARLAKITGDDKYLKFMDQEYHVTYDLLFDKEEKLFYRDTRFFTMNEENGKKLLWARGNGWVLAGLALMIPDLPKDWQGREFYVDLFKTLAESVKGKQRPDGTWSMGLLGDITTYPAIETSSTAFFTFGLAWGINTGLLDRATCEPVVLKAWNALAAAVTPEGMLGYVQPVGGEPGESIKDKTEVYAIGAFLAAGSEVYKMLENAPAAAFSTEPATFARFVPERKDDFAWENDRVAFRAYGPALRDGKENSGFDAWLKRVDYPIINKWYQGDQEGISYHKDHGEGLDNFHVGSSAGCGGTGLWIDGKRVPLETYTKYEILESTPERTRFKLHYEKDVDGVPYREEKTITIELSSQLFQVDSVFFKDGEPAAALPVCIGLTLANGEPKTFSDKNAGWIATWGLHEDSELGTGARMSPGQLDKIEIVQAEQKDDRHIFLVGHTDDQGKLSYKTGFAWKKAGRITSAEDWQKYLNQ
jgi:rhamnogalacturonyl hydrolase YesR